MTMSPTVGSRQLTSIVGSQVGWAMQFGTIPANDVLAAYWARLKDRPARLAADGKDNALIPARTS